MIDPIALRDIWDAHSDRLMLIGRSMVDPADASDAEDAVQEAFIALAVQSEPPDDPLAWMIRVVRNQLLQWRRSHGRRRRREHRCHDQRQPPAAWLSHPQLAVDRRLDARAVTAALAELPDDQRQVIVMHLWGEMSFERIAGVVGGSRSAVHRLYGRGLEQLKTRFDPNARPISEPPAKSLRDETDTVVPRG